MEKGIDYWRLLQLRVLGFRFFQDRDVGIGVFPESEEVFVGVFGLGPIPREAIGKTAR